MRRKDDEHCETIASLPLNTCKVLLSCSSSVYLKSQSAGAKVSEASEPSGSTLEQYCGRGHAGAGAGRGK